ncbi:MAG TPA: hypothetical protein VKM54_15795 [Myxococcota bacterium]|nr:hypothetical protein [Myxococcota bacterium]
MSSTPATFDDLPRAVLLPVALETMHVGHLLDRALMPQVVIATKNAASVEEVAILEWMGASPVYTARMRRLMGIEGDGVDAIMKALQLDVGFPHQYMDVGWKLVDARYGEFWLRHCGALMDVEPHGEERVIGMCHHIEDPTFDATAYATNPRARVRPIHRPPRVPVDRMPHCHWTIEIDHTNEPVSAAAHTGVVAALPLARIENRCAAESTPVGMTDYSGPFDPEFRLGRLSSATLAAVAREFQVQTHLLSCSAEITLAERLGRTAARDLIAAQWIAASWVASQRLAKALGETGGGTHAVAAVLRGLATLPPGFRRSAEISDERVRFGLEPANPDLLDPEHPGWLGLLVRGDRGGVEAAAQAVEPRARLTDFSRHAGCLSMDFTVEAGAVPAAPPPAAAFMRFSTATSFVFDLNRAR